MNPRLLIRWLRYWQENRAFRLAMPFVLPVLFGTLQWMAWDLLRPTYFILFFPAVILAALVGGFGAGMFTTAISAAIANFFFMPPEFRFFVDNASAMQIAVFALNCLVISGVTDLLARKQREMMNARIHEAIGGMREAYLSVNADGVVAYANARADEMRMKRGDTIVGKRLWELYPELKGSELHRRMDEAMSTQKPVFFEAKSLDGSRWVEHRIYPAEAGVTIFSDDITERVKSRKALEEKTREAVEANEQLRWTNSELERSNSELEQFAHVASHDMKEPLRMIANYVRLLEEDYGHKLDDNGKMFIDFAAKGAMRLHALLNDILAHSQVQSEPFECRSFRMSDSLNEAMEQLKARIAETGARVSFERLPNIPYDPRQLVRVFQNLLANALKFRRPDVTPEIRIRAEETPVEWIVTVSDNGIGVEPEDRERIFELFKRAHSQDEFPGSGIGLSTCKTIVERMGGSIWVESEPNQGSSFHFTIPKEGTLRRRLSPEPAKHV